MMNDRIQSIATRIADCSTRSEIELFCLSAHSNDLRWYDITSVDTENAPFVAEAVEYLELRAALIRHPVHNHLVRWE